MEGRRASNTFILHITCTIKGGRGLDSMFNGVHESLINGRPPSVSLN